MPEPTTGPTAQTATTPVQGSVFVTGQVVSHEQRRGRYTRESMAHPGKMLPSIARYLIATYTHVGEWVCDPMAGIATTIVEAMHLGRNGIGVEYEARWARLAAGNLSLAAAQGATGTGEVYHGDSRHLPALIPPELHGRIALVITSPPYGPSTHGHVRTPGPRRGKVRKIDNRYGADPDNLAYQTHDQLAEGFTRILTGVAAILRPGGHVAITARPYRRHGELIDIPGMVVAAGTNAGLHLHEECAALIAGIRDGRLIPRASFFQQKNVRAASADGDPQWLLQHEDVLVFRSPTIPLPPAVTGADTSPGGPDWEPTSTVHGGPQPSQQLPTQPESVSTNAHPVHRLDVFTPARVDRRPQPAHPTIAQRRDSAAEPQSHRDGEPERTPIPWPPDPRPTPGSEPPATAYRGPTGNDTPRPQAGPSNTAGPR